MHVFNVTKRDLEWYKSGQKTVEIRPVGSQWENIRRGDIVTIRCEDEDLKKKVAQIQEGRLIDIVQKFGYIHIFPEVTNSLGVLWRIRALYPTPSPRKFIAFELVDELMQKGAIAFLDALGTKGIWSKAKPSSVIRSWDKVLHVFERSIEEARNEAGEKCEGFRIAAFSDTVIAILKGQDPVALIPLMGKAVLAPFLSGLFEGLYFRGVISAGQFYESDTLLIGPAIDDAAEWYTQPDWIGVSTTLSATYGLEGLRNAGKNGSEWFVKYDIPTKSGTMGQWALAWPRQAVEGALDDHERISEVRARIYDTFSDRPIDPYARSKCDNTLSFFDYITGSRGIGSGVSGKH